MSGFYKSEDGILIYAPNFVACPEFSLLRDKKDLYEYPVDGWYWFDSDEEAYTVLGIPRPDAKSSSATTTLEETLPQSRPRLPRPE